MGARILAPVAKLSAVRRPVLWLALICHLVFAGLYALYTPAFEGLDENDHCYYACYVQHTGSLPVIGDRSGMAGGSLAHHPPLYYLGLGAVMSSVGTGDYVPFWSDNPTWAVEGEQRRLRWQHGHDEVSPVSAEISVLRAMRALSVLIGLVSIVLVHRLAILMFPGWPGVAGFAALLLACVPQWSWVHGSLDNGNLATMWTGAALVVMAGSLRRGQLGWREGLALGVVAGLALITKLTSIFLLPLLGVTYLHALFRWRSARSQVLWSGCVALAVIVALSGWFFMRNWDLYGELLALNAHREAFAENLVPDEARLEYLAGRFLPTLFGTSLAGFGWSAVRLPWSVELGALLLVLLAVVGWARRGGRLLEAAGPAVWLCALAVLLVVASVIRYNASFYQPQGRYLFPAYAPLAVLLSAGWAASFSGRLGRLRPLVYAAPVVFGGLVFALVFRPAMAAETVGDRHYASMIEGLRDGPSASRAAITALEPAQDAELVAPPTFRWRDPGHATGMRYSVHLLLQNGLPMGTYESGLIEIGAAEWQMPAALWQSIDAGQPFSWKVRRLPDRASGERAADAPESPPRRLTRR